MLDTIASDAVVVGEVYTKEKCLESLWFIVTDCYHWLHTHKWLEPNADHL